MGPPLPAKASAHRYNRAGAPVLYLCDSVGGVRRELGADVDELYIQRFSVPVNDLHVADLTAVELPEVIRGAFYTAELIGVMGLRTPLETFAFSQALAEMIAGAGFDGMLVPGVRGEREARYTNLVVFHFDNWRSWSLQAAGFREPMRDSGIVRPGAQEQRGAGA
jgi:hypothetical protein